MWLEKIIELKKQTGTTTKYIADHIGKSERTVRRFFNGDSNFGIDDVREIVLLMGGSLDDILDESDFKLPTPEIEALNKKIDVLSKQIEEMKLNESMLNAENAVMKDKICSLTAENDLLRMKLELKEEIIAIHKFYMKENH